MKLESQLGITFSSITYDDSHSARPTCLRVNSLKNHFSYFIKYIQKPEYLMENAIHTTFIGMVKSSRDLEFYRTPL